jgi:hypothetical protein
MKKMIMVLAILAMAATAANAQLVITGVFDGPLTGGIPKFVELYACDDIADLSVYGVGSANNGGGTDGVEFTFPADAVAAGSFIYLSLDVPSFNTYFGFDPDYTDGSAPNINGDDAIELFFLGGTEPVVVDVFGDIFMDGTGTGWDHLDGWAKRISGTGPDGDVFDIAAWTFSGINATDGCLTNDSCGSVFPLGAYECDPAVDEDTANFGTIKALFR